MSMAKAKWLLLGITLAILLIPALAGCGKSKKKRFWIPGAALPDLVVTEIDAYHYDPASSPWFNVSNEVDVTVSNIGVENAGAFNLCLYANGSLIDEKPVSGLAAGNSAVVQFLWIPVGDDCLQNGVYADTSADYELRAVVNSNDNVEEKDETNNEMTEVEKACYNGYLGDEPLVTAAHGMLNGGMIFTTGDGVYGKLDNIGSVKSTVYNITIPAGATVELARLNVYYTWHYEKDSLPQMKVSVNGTPVTIDNAYNDIKCQHPDTLWNYPWGNYVYDVTTLITGNGAYTVTVERTAGPSFCIAAPGLVIVYEDNTKPLIEYWINEGADMLIGGRRHDGGYLSPDECVNTALFPGDILIGTVTQAVLGVVSPWTDSDPDDVISFNGVEIGKGLYQGYDNPVDTTVGAMSMHIGSSNAQVGIHAAGVMAHLQASDNVASQGDDGDCMMPANAFLVVEYAP